MEQTGGRPAGRATGAEPGDERGGGTSSGSVAEVTKREILNVRAEAVRQRTPLQRALTRIASILSSPIFFISEVVFHLGWIALNSGAVPGVRPWDPFPFAFLTGTASVQALFIGLLILMYAEHDSHISDV